MNPLSVTDADVNAYVDGQLAPARMPAVEDAIDRDPALAARVAELRRQNAALRDAFDTWIAEAPPARLVAATMSDPARRRSPPWLRAAFAAAASLIVGLGIGWFGRDAIASARRHAYVVHAPGGARARAICERRESPGRDLGRGRATPRAVALAPSRVPGAGAGSQLARLRAGRWPPGGRQRESHCALRLREPGQAAPHAAGAQAHACRSTRRRSVMQWRTASACTTGSRRIARTRCRAISTARNCSRSAAWFTASSRRSKPRA